MTKKISDEDLISELKRLADELDRTPRKRDMEEHGKYSPSVYYDRFESWTNAQEAADVGTTGNGHPNKIPTEDLLNEIRRLADELGHRPGKNDMDEHGKYSPSVYYDRFESWIDAVEKADVDEGLEGKAHPTKISTEDLLDEIRRLADELGHSPTTSDMNNDGKYHATAYYDRFGSWTDAVREAGHEPVMKGSRITDDDLLDELRRLADITGEPVSTADMAEHGKYSFVTYMTRFGSWTEAAEVAGIEARSTDGEIPVQKLLDDLKRVQSRVDHEYVRMNEYDADGEYSANTIVRRFGSWSAALEAAGLPSEPQNNRRRKYSDEQLLDEIRRLADELGREPEVQDMKDRGKYGLNTYVKRFGSWTAAKEQAGVVK